MRKFVIAAVSIAALAFLVAATASRDTCLGSFDANMQFGSASGKGSAMKFDGKLAWAKPNLRLDLTEKTTKEKMVVLVDFTGGDATLLYPDTLNGFKTTLPAMDSAGYIRQFQHLLTPGGKLADGWKKERAGSEKVGGATATKYKITGPAGEQAFWWVDAKEKPFKVQAGRGKSTVTLNFGQLNFGAKVPAKTFSYSKDFSVINFNGNGGKLPMQP